MCVWRVGFEAFTTKRRDEKTNIFSSTNNHPAHCVLCYIVSITLPGKYSKSYMFSAHSLAVFVTHTRITATSWLNLGTWFSLMLNFSCARRPITVHVRSKPSNRENCLAVLDSLWITVLMVMWRFLNCLQFIGASSLPYSSMKWKIPSIKEDRTKFTYTYELEYIQISSELSS
jgi:hypothetical protein